MELEVACRYRLPITFVIINNSGIYAGLDELPEDRKLAPVTALSPETRYEKVRAARGLASCAPPRR